MDITLTTEQLEEIFEGFDFDSYCSEMINVSYLYDYFYANPEVLEEVLRELPYKTEQYLQKSGIKIIFND